MLATSAKLISEPISRVDVLTNSLARSLTAELIALRMSARSFAELPDQGPTSSARWAPSTASSTSFWSASGTVATTRSV
jgi:hypothetical protein